MGGPLEEFPLPPGKSIKRAKRYLSGEKEKGRNGNVIRFSITVESLPLSYSD